MRLIWICLGQSEGRDVVDTRGGRRVLVAFAMDQDSHLGFYFDLMDESDRPRVWEANGDRLPDYTKIVDSTPLIGWLRELERRR